MAVPALLALLLGLAGAQPARQGADETVANGAQEDDIPQGIRARLDRPGCHGCGCGIGCQEVSKKF